jgi:hypothetical protein
MGLSFHETGVQPPATVFPMVALSSCALISASRCDGVTGRAIRLCFSTTFGGNLRRKQCDPQHNNRTKHNRNDGIWTLLISRLRHRP